MQRRNFANLVVAAGLVALPLELAKADEPLEIVATTGMIADAVTQVGGDKVEVKTLMGPGIDPHAYRQTRSDIVALAKADIVFWHGLFLEAQMEDFLRELEQGRSVIAVAEALPKDLLIAHDDYANRHDPHVWMAPDLWQMVVDRIRDALIEKQPQDAETFRQNAQQYQAELRKIGDYAQEVLGSVPADNRVLLTSHDAFNYFGAAYDFEVVGVQGISTESEAGLQRIGELVDLLSERDLGAVFVESSVSDRNMRALIEGAAAEGHEVSIGGELFSDAMGAFGTYEGTYIGMIDHNVSTIARALGGTVPDGGMSGLLN